MKYAEFYINSQKVEFFNSIFGNERVVVNGAEVSNKFSFFGTKHRWDLDSDNFTLSSSWKALGRQILDLKLEKNQFEIENSNIDLNPNYKISWGALVIIWGYILYKPLFRLFESIF